MIANLLKYVCATNYRNRERFDKDIAKIKRCSFLPHMVDDCDCVKTVFALCYVDCLGVCVCVCVFDCRF